MEVNREDLRNFTIQYLANTGMSKSDLSLKIGLSRALLSRYLSDKYDSDPSNIENALMNYFKNIEKESEGESDDMDVKPMTDNKSRKVADFFCQSGCNECTCNLRSVPEIYRIGRCCGTKRLRKNPYT